LENALRGELDASGQCVNLGEGQFAIVLRDCDRADGLETARQLRRAAAALCHDTDAITLSIGLASLAVPSKNFPAHELIAAAARCLSAAQLAGGDTVKSIEIV
jgi:GGDEF domain-containing protein